jgi:mRNA-degrading endonuclease RelE of RelBE toxin-antitoxin system
MYKVVFTRRALKDLENLDRGCRVESLLNSRNMLKIP